MQIGELFIALGFDVDDKKLNDFGDNLKGVVTQMGKVAGIAAGALYALDRFVAGSIKGATELRNFSDETNNSFEALQKWQVASVLTNASATADGVTASFRAMATAIADVTQGNGPSGAFARLGIADVRGMEVGQVLEQLRQNFDANVSRWGHAQTVNLMKEVGLDANMLQALRLANSEFEQLTMGRYLDESQIQRLAKLGDTINKVKQSWSQFQDSFVANNGDRIGQFFENVSTGVMTVARGLEQLFEWAKRSEGPLKLVLGVIVGAAAGIAIAAGGFTALAAAALALLAALDRIGEWMKNNDEFFKDMERLGKLITIPGLREWATNVREKGEQKAKEIGIEDPNRFGNFFRGLTVEGGEARAQNMMRNMGVPANDLGAASGGWQETRPAISNVYNIDGARDPRGLSDEIVQQQQRQLNATYSDFNNGPKY